MKLFMHTLLGASFGVVTVGLICVIAHPPIFEGFLLGTVVTAGTLSISCTSVWCYEAWKAERERGQLPE